MSVCLKIIVPQAAVEITLEPGYPETFAEFHITSNIFNHSNCIQTEKQVQHELTDVLGEPHIWQIVNLVENILENFETGENEMLNLNLVETVPFGLVLNYDHMRAKQKYVRQIQTWCRDLQIVGRLIFWERLIFNILVGDEESIKEFLKLSRTVSVDIDSRGRKCKEHQMKIIFRANVVQTHEYWNWDSFMVKDCTTFETFQNQLVNIPHQLCNEILNFL